MDLTKYSDRKLRPYFTFIEETVVLEALPRYNEDRIVGFDPRWNHENLVFPGALVRLVGTLYLGGSGTNATDNVTSIVEFKEGVFAFANPDHLIQETVLFRGVE